MSATPTLQEYYEALSKRTSIGGRKKVILRHLIAVVALGAGDDGSLLGKTMCTHYVL